MGSFTAYWVKTMFPSFTVIVVERDNDVRSSAKIIWTSFE